MSMAKSWPFIIVNFDLSLCGYNKHFYTRFFLHYRHEKRHCHDRPIGYTPSVIQSDIQSAFLPEKDIDHIQAHLGLFYLV